MLVIYKDLHNLTSCQPSKNSEEYEISSLNEERHIWPMGVKDLFLHYSIHKNKHTTSNYYYYSCTLYYVSTTIPCN